ncbi:MAG: SDR family oxidoreductase [Spirochaetales bacterium]|nr:SDR family oxidoreductase [Spirochaetales bacterium]
MFRLVDRIAVLTGGLGQLGHTFTEALLGAGARVVCLDIATPTARKLEDFKEALDNGRLKFFQIDITSRKELEKIHESVVSTWGTPHILVNNAAIDSPPDSPPEENGPFEDYPASSLDNVLNINVKGVFTACQVFGRSMARAGRGSIINLGSIYGMLSPVQDIYEFRRKNGAEFYKPAPYAISKAGIINLTRYLATYWARQGVRVNALSPAGIFNNQPQEFLEEYCRRMPVGRMAMPEEMAGPLIFLASDASSYMTGANLVVDGGWTAW